MIWGNIAGFPLFVGRGNGVKKQWLGYIFASLGLRGSKLNILFLCIQFRKHDSISRGGEKHMYRTMYSAMYSTCEPSASSLVWSIELTYLSAVWSNPHGSVSSILVASPGPQLRNSLLLQGEAGRARRNCLSAAGSGINLALHYFVGVVGYVSASVILELGLIDDRIDACRCRHWASGWDIPVRTAISLPFKELSSFHVCHLKLCGKEVRMKSSGKFSVTYRLVSYQNQSCFAIWRRLCLRK